MMSDRQPPHPLAAVAEAYPAFGAALRRHEAGDMAAARMAYLDLMDQPALTALCLHQLGLIAAARGENARAVELFRRAIRIEPTQPLAYHNLKSALERAGDPAGATATLVDLGCVLYNQPNYAEAAQVFRQVIARDPINYAAQVNLGTALAWMEDYRDAARHLILGIELYGRLVREVDIFIRQITGELKDWLRFGPDHAMLPPGIPTGSIEKVEDALTTLGKLLNECGFLPQAMACLRKSVEMAPGFALGHWNLSLALLGTNDFTQGWREYEWRWHWDRFPEPRRLLPMPLWRGEPLAGRHILVWAEQGFGDGIQFAPLAEALLEKGARVTLEAPSPLVRLFANSYPGITVIARPDNPHQVASEEPFDFVVPLMSLPERLGLTPAGLPLARTYLKASPGDRARWAERLPAAGRKRVGIVWAGRPAQADDVRRSVPFDIVRRLFRNDTLLWHSLQVGPAQSRLKEAPEVVDLSPELTDFAETAAAIGRLDLVISVCTSVAHLAGALGAPVWLMARQPSDWRWSGGGAASPWYESMRIFRQERAGDWASVVAAVARALDEL